IVRQVRLFVEQHGESRFRRLDNGGDSEHERAIINRAGYFDGDTYFFSREVFKVEVCRGFDPTHAAKALEHRKLLIANHGLQHKRRDPETGKTTTFYAVSAEIMD